MYADVPIFMDCCALSMYDISVPFCARDLRGLPFAGTTGMMTSPDVPLFGLLCIPMYDELYLFCVRLSMGSTVLVLGTTGTMTSRP